MTATKPQAEPKARPILFSGPMIRAILEGRKTQTRRALRNQPADGLSSPYTVPGAYNDDWMMLNAESHSRSIGRCRYGKPGDRLWVRETWRHRAYGMLITEKGERGEIKVQYRADDNGSRSIYAPNEYFMADHKYRTSEWVVKPSIFMPRWASRITLQIESIRVERLQEISEEDAKAEGLLAWKLDDMPAYEGARDSLHVTAVSAYASLWNSINLKRGYGWSLNPWVWVVTFSQVK